MSAGTGFGAGRAVAIEYGRVGARGQEPSRSARAREPFAYIASETGRRVYALDVDTGDERWHFDIEGDVACCLGVGNGLVVVPTTMGSLYGIGGDGPGNRAQAVAKNRRSAVP